MRTNLIWICQERMGASTMNSFFKWTFRLVVLFVVLAIIGAVFGYFLLKRSIPDYNLDETQSFGSYQVEILRDLQAVPHIYGATENDALFALGYAHAQDRLWQMDSARRTVQGRLSEIFGSQTLDVDKYFRALDLWNLANRAAATLPPEDLARLQAYSDGVNAYIYDINKNKRGSGAPEFLFFSHQISPWTPTDSLAMLKLMAMQLTGAASEEILQAKFATVLTPQEMNDIFYDVSLPANFDRLSYQGRASEFAPSQLAQILNPVQGVDLSGASNAFIAAPDRTANSHAILANDPHLKFSAPTIWMLAHLHFEDLNEDVIGATIPGVPLVIIGHNNHLAWGLTTSYLDDQDLVIMKREAADPAQYKTEDGILTLEREAIEISVDGQDEPEIFVRERSIYGPIIPFDGPLKVEEVTPEGHMLALSWTALQENDHSIRTGFKFSHAKSVPEAEEALADYVAPAQIFSFADKDGNIAQIAGGVMPKRAEDNPTRGTMPAANWIGTPGFIGNFPFEQNPRLFNPSDGLLIHTNNKFIDDIYPRHFSYKWGDVYRRLRAEELLGIRKYHTMSSFQGAQNDALSEAARTLLPLIAREFWFKPDKNEQKSNVLKELANWDGEYDALLAEPLIFTAWLEELNNLIFADELGEFYQDLGRVDPLRLERIFRNVDGAARWCDIRPTPQVEICSDISSMSLDRALDKLNAQYGSNFEEWRWGRAHRAVQRNQFLSKIPVFGGLSNIVQEQSGDTQTLLRQAYPGGEDYDFDANHGAGLRMVVDFSDIDHSKFIISSGQSGHVLSPYYDDLSTLWRNGEYINMTTNRKVIEGNLRGRIVFEPSGRTQGDAQEATSSE